MLIPAGFLHGFVTRERDTEILYKCTDHNAPDCDGAVRWNDSKIDIEWGLSLTYIAQPSPDGLAQAHILAEDFLARAPSTMVLGDNIFFGHGLPDLLAEAGREKTGGTVFGYRVADPGRYGVVDFAADGTVKTIIAKPKLSPSHFAVTGLYFLDGTAPARAP